MRWIKFSETTWFQTFKYVRHWSYLHNKLIFLTLTIDIEENLLIVSLSPPENQPEAHDHKCSTTKACTKSHSEPSTSGLCRAWNVWKFMNERSDGRSAQAQIEPKIRQEWRTKIFEADSHFSNNFQWPVKTIIKKGKKMWFWVDDWPCWRLNCCKD